MRKTLQSFFSNLVPSFLAGLVVAVLCASPAWAAVKDRIHGKADAPITVIEYASYTCSHCADFYAKTMPEIEKNYIETGKVKFILRTYPSDGYSMKASALAHCLPEDMFYPFSKVLFENFKTWTKAPDPLERILQYAQMAGLSPDKAKTCMEDTDALDDLVKLRTEASDKYSVDSTPTFIINDGAEKIVGAREYQDFKTVFDGILNKKK